MSNLKIELYGPEGLAKTWLARPQDQALNIGKSRYADLQISLDEIAGVEARVEYRNQQWNLIHLTSIDESASPEQKIEQLTELKVGNWKLKFSVYELGISILNSLMKISDSEQSVSKEKAHLVLITHQGQLIKSETVPYGSRYKFMAGDLKFDKKLEPVLDWKHEKIGAFEFSTRMVDLNTSQTKSLLKHENLTDENGKKIVHGTLAGSFFFLLIFMLLGPGKTVEEIQEQKIPQAYQREIKMSVPKKRKTQSQASAAPAAPSSDSAPSAKPASNDKQPGQFFAKSRISALIGRITSSSNKVNRQIIVTNSASATRTVASIDSLGGEKRDWNQVGSSGNGKGQGYQIGTVGTGTGGGTGALGKIAKGNAGNGQAQLLEDDGEVVGGLDREVIANYIRTRLGEVLYCYERQLSAQPNLFGKVAVKFTIGASGKVETQKVSETTLANQSVEGCILSRLSKWEFPKPQGGTTVVVTYPFLFKSTN